MVDEISKEKIEQHVRKMVSFHTRHNLSEQNDPDKGIGASWNWIKSEMEKSIPSSGWPASGRVCRIYGRRTGTKNCTGDKTKECCGYFERY